MGVACQLGLSDPMWLENCLSILGSIVLIRQSDVCLLMRLVMRLFIHSLLTLVHSFGWFLINVVVHMFIHLLENLVPKHVDGALPIVGGDQQIPGMEHDCSKHRTGALY